MPDEKEPVYFQIHRIDGTIETREASETEIAAHKRSLEEFQKYKEQMKKDQRILYFFLTFMAGAMVIGMAIVIYLTPPH